MVRIILAGSLARRRHGRPSAGLRCSRRTGRPDAGTGRQASTGRAVTGRTGRDAALQVAGAPQALAELDGGLVLGGFGIQLLAGG